MGTEKPPRQQSCPNTTPHLTACALPPRTPGRSLGIPTRPVTNFQSAHDSNRNRAIEKFFEIKTGEGGAETFNPVDGYGVSSDSVWSFHVWNEMYFKRQDIDCKMLGLRARCADGWQAVDATPQEHSAGGSVAGSLPVYQMGPASIKLIKANKHPHCYASTGKVYGCYDHEFVTSEVNADVHIWLKDSEKGWTFSGSFETDPWEDPYNTIGKPAPHSLEQPRAGAAGLVTCDLGRPEELIGFALCAGSCTTSDR